MKYTKNFSDACCNKTIIPEIGDISEEILVQEQFKEGGRTFSKTVAKVIDPRDRFKGITVEDFALENLLAAGATDVLRPVSISGSTLGDVDNITSTLENINISEGE